MSVTKETDIFCIGNALVDIFASADEQNFIRFGLDKAAQHIEYEKILSILSVLPRQNSSPMVFSSGGGAANTAKIAGFLGASVCFAGAVCNDYFGQLFEKELNQANVKTPLFFRSAPTGLCLYLKAGSETRAAAAPSAALEFSEKDINEEDIQKAKLVFVDGFMLGKKGLVRHILDLADKHKTVAALDLSSAFIAKECAAEILDYVNKYPLILFMNEAEALSVSASLREENWENFFQSLTAGKEFPVIVVTLGCEGAVCFANGETHRSETRKKINPESTGAGDAFCAGFLTAWVQGKDLSECAALGNKTARLVLGSVGTKVDGEKFRTINGLR